MRITIGLVMAMLAFGCVAVWFFGQWPRRANFPGVARAATEAEIRTRRSGSIRDVAAKPGGIVRAGDVLAMLEDPEDGLIVREAEWALREAEIAEAQSWRDDDRRLETRTRDAELERRRVELDALGKRGEYLAVPAPAGGVIAAWDETLVPGVPVGQGVTMGWVTDGGVDFLSCYPDMETAGKLEAGMAVRFFPDSGEGAVDGVVTGVERSRPEILADAELAGALGAVDSGGVLVLPGPYAKVAVRLGRPLSRSGQTGRVWAWTRPESLADATMLWLEALAVRESAF